MHLVVKKDGRIINEFSFDTGPVYIGRYKYNQVFLPDLSVSRQHAAIFTTLEGKWVIEDMNSANKTYLNGEEIQKAEIKTGDCIHISNFTIDIDLEQAPATERPIHLEDTLVPEARQVGKTSDSNRDIIIRNPHVIHAPDITLPAGRIKDFLEATETICRTNGIEEVQAALLDMMLKHFIANQVWCALRDDTEGPMACQAGKNRDGSSLILGDIQINQKITEAIGTTEFQLLTRVPISPKGKKINSAMIAPVIDPAGCFGVLYVANAMDSEHYSLSDLDYLMLLAIHTAAIVENF